jgi:hypothetical protein
MIFPLGESRIRKVVRMGVTRWPEQAAGQRSHGMTRYLISFDASAMNHIPDEDILP